ncbi:MAG TPA: hypothetical protein H9867_00635 [Candidatus Corynebacterium gallistercoris]|uniref:Abi-like protein n=1 Tax=Candidatus Corynebacterium gallistercoris TaxID=2838530 RepID=A0A9D1RYH6_9CORY|nr:hypothetical protein [Candidatus Corynebacterium gallistercoris]
MQDQTRIRSRVRVALSSSHLATFQQACQSDEAALDLYKWNVKASAGVLELTGIVEVFLRNALDQTLTDWMHTQDHQESWIDSVPLNQRGKADIATAKTRASRRRRAYTHNDIIAELSFGFWRYLLENRYYTSLWIPAIHKAFPNASTDLRRRANDVQLIVRGLHELRNRAAHHEPIITRNLRNDVTNALLLLEWIDPALRIWTKEILLLPTIIEQNPQG